MQKNRTKVVKKSVAPRNLLLILVFIFFVVFLAGGYYYLNHREQIKQEKINELAAVTQSKVRRIANWKRKLAQFAQTSVANPLITDELEFYINSRGRETHRKYVALWLDDQQTKHYKSVYLLDRSGQICTSDDRKPSDAPPDALVSELFERGSRQGQIVFSDLYTNSSDEIVFALLIPLMRDQTLFGALLAEIDPHNYLFPLLAEWPVPSQTAETLMVRRQGDAILYLNELRHRKNTAMKLRLPLQGRHLQALYVAMNEPNRGEGVDYRGVDVIATIEKVPDTNWHLIAKVDKKEIFRHLNATITQLFFWVAALFIILAWVAAAIINKQRVQLAQTKRQCQTDRQALVRHFDYLSQNANDFILLLGASGEILYANRKAQTLYGFQLDELLGMRLDALWEPSPSRERFKEILSDAALLQEGAIFEAEHRKQNGAVFTVECSVCKVEVQGVCYFQIIGRDISLKKENDAKIKMLSQAIEQSPTAIVITDLDANIEYVNSTFTHMTGYSSDEVIGQNTRILQSGQTPAHVISELWTKIKAGEVWHGELYNRRKDGSLFWEDATILPLKDDQKRITNYMALKIDITPKKKLEAQLEKHRKELEQKVKERTSELNHYLQEAREAKNQMEWILASIADGLIVTDLNSRIVLINRVAQEMFQVSASDVVDQSLDALISREHIQKDFKMVPKEQHADVVFDFEIADPDSNETKTFNARASVYKDEKEKKCGEIILFRDVTQMREAQRIKNEFISMAAHELRTPLTSIQGFSELLMLRDDLSPEEKRRYLNIINQKAVNLSEIICDLLDIDQIESGRSFKLQKKTCSIDQIIKDVVELFSATEEKHRFETHFAEPDVNLYIDRNKIHQALKNLIDNAVKYAPAGGLIRVSGQKRQECYEIVIQDQGIGMTPKETSKVFIKFYRANATTTSVEGTGLGMTISKYIVEAHQGKISVASELGKGTTVVVTLPLPPK